MKKILLLALPVLVAAAIAVPAAFAGNGPAPKATGDIWYTNQWTGEPTHVTFVAQDLGSSAKGSLSYQDLRGSYQARVISAHVGDTPNSFSFTAQITSSTGAYAEGASEPRPVGLQVPLVVTDKGESGVNDSFAWQNPDDNVTYELGPLTAGNIQVH